MTTDQEEQAERRRVLLQDADVRRQQQEGSTYLDQYHSEVGGRFSVTQNESVTGRVSPKPPPLPANSPWHGPDPVPDEPPLGYRVDGCPNSNPRLVSLQYLHRSQLTTQLQLHPAAVVQLPTVARCLSGLGRLLFLRRTKTMPDRAPSAAASLYPHLPHDNHRQAQWSSNTAVTAVMSLARCFHTCARRHHSQRPIARARIPGAWLNAPMPILGLNIGWRWRDW